MPAVETQLHCLAINLSLSRSILSFKPFQHKWFLLVVLILVVH